MISRHQLGEGLAAVVKDFGQYQAVTRGAVFCQTALMTLLFTVAALLPPETSSSSTSESSRKVSFSIYVFLK
jgi:hypothetical protein